VDLLPLFIDAVETAVRDRVATGDMVAVVGELFSRCETWSFADNFVALDHQLTAIRMHHHPFPAEKCHRPVRSIFDGDKVNKRVRFVGRERRPAVVIGEFVEAGG